MHRRHTHKYSDDVYTNHGAAVILMAMWYSASLISFVELFARSGGGGSSSSGSGGGGFGGFIAIGYVVMFYTAKPFKKLLPRETAFIVTIPIAVALTILAIVIAALSSTFIGWWFGIEFIIGIWMGWTGQMYSLWDRMKKNFKKADDDLAKAGWNETELQQVASQAFMRYQYDWSTRDASHFYEYMTPSYAGQATLMVRALTELRRFDVMNNLQIIRIDTSAVYDNPDDTQDFFSVLIEAQANDVLMDESQKTLFTDNNPFIEEWTFQRGNGTWLLANIRQTTEAQNMMEADMRQFATTYGMYYSLDMGWLFIPTRGELFNNGKWSFGQSDINNHVIGLYNNHLVQLYTYKQIVDNNKNSKNYLVGQITVPKEYGGILIERKKGLIHRMFAPKGYQKYDLEWPDFNDRYGVYATDQSRLATFELLNPGFMAYLYDNFNDINIEVVDNTIYFYAPKTGARGDYEQLMLLLTKAFKELQL